MSVNLDIDQVTSGQDQKEVTINDATGQLDAAITEFLLSDYTSGDITLTDTEFRRNLLFRTDNLSVARTLSVPAIKHLFVVDNTNGTSTLTVSRGTTDINLLSTENGVFYTDGTANGLIQTGGSGGGGAAADPVFSMFFPTAPASAELLVRFVFAESVDFPSGLTGSQGFLGTAATAQTDFDIQRNGVNVGIMRFAISGTVATFIMASVTSYAAGDTLEIVAPAGVDATASDVSAALTGTRT